MRQAQPGYPSGVLMVVYLEGIASERGIAWRCRDAISLPGVSGLLRCGEDTAGASNAVEGA